MHPLEESVFEMYKNRAIGTNPVCQQCRAAEAQRGRRLSDPVSFWHIGSRFRTDPQLVVFVGKNPVDGNELDWVNNVHDAREAGMKLYRMKHSSFWIGIEKIMCSVFGTDREDALARIAITNLMKCNHSTGEETKDTTSASMKTYCVDRLGVVWSELDLLEPYNVIFFTHFDTPTKASYDAQIAGFVRGDDVCDITNRNTAIYIKRRDKTMRVGWWHREFVRDGQVMMRVLRTSHPQGKDTTFLDSVAAWILQGGARASK